MINFIAEKLRSQDADVTGNTIAIFNNPSVSNQFQKGHQAGLHRRPLPVTVDNPNFPRQLTVGASSSFSLIRFFGLLNSVLISLILMNVRMYGIRILYAYSYA